MIRHLTNSLLAALLFSPTILAAEPATRVDDFQQRIQPVLQMYCYDCHGRTENEGKVNLTDYTTWKELEKNPQLIGKIIDALDKNEMPPEQSRQPSETERQSLLNHLNKSLTRSLTGIPKAASLPNEAYEPL